MRRYKHFNVFVTLSVSIVSIILAVFCFRTSYMRFGETLGDLWQSILYYFYEVFGVGTETAPTVGAFSEVLKWNIFLPSDLEAFKVSFGNYFALLWTRENLLLYLYYVLNTLGIIAQWIATFLPAIALFIMLVKRLYESENNDYNKDTIPLRIFKFLRGAFYYPIKYRILSLWEFLSRHTWITKLWIFIWIFNLNISSVISAFFAYYMYFAVSLDFEGIYIQICKLLVDLQIIIEVIPLWLFIILYLFWFNRWRIGIAKARLRHFERKNCGLINELPIVSMTCGSMGKKKTTIITDMGLSQEVMFRQKAFALLKENDLRFPHFPWLLFEKDLKRAMEYHEVYNLATVKKWINKKKDRFLKNGDLKKRLYGYDAKAYGMVSDDGLKKRELFDCLSSYAQLYFIYVIESSLLVSNYSIRTDNNLIDEGNFPMWLTDFFPETNNRDSRHAHILDFDVLRLGKKVIENNEKAGSFEFGVVLISEVGKERGNVLDHKEMKKNQDETNQKNDLFNSWLKMCRHSATVDNFPFVKVFTDEQRPESWGADARDLCDIMTITSSGPQRIALPFYTIEEMIYEVALDKFIDFYYDMRFRRGDNTLLVHILKTVCAALYKHNAKMYNKYGYSISHIEKERGTMDGKVEKKKYYLMNQKIYSNRFSTDCFSDYFNERAKNTNLGINDYLEYETERATVEELKEQNSYFINALYKNAGSN